jgi:hypothetical protein
MSAAALLGFGCAGAPEPQGAVVAPVSPSEVAPPVAPRTIDVVPEPAGAGRLPSGGHFEDGLVFVSTPSGLLTSAPKSQDAYATLHVGRPDGAGFSWETVPNPGSATTLRAIGFQGSVVAIGAEAARVVAWRPGAALVELGSWDWLSEYDGWMDGVVADLDADGDDDIALGGYDAGVLMIGRAVADGIRFDTLRATDATRVASVGWGDVDGDGRPELVTTRARGLRGEAGEIEVLSRTGDRWTATAVWEADAWFTREVRVGDVDGDGRADVLGLRPGLKDRDAVAGAVLVRFDTNTVPWTPRPVATIPSPACHNTAFADVDGDGRQDWIGSCTPKGVFALRKGVVESVDAASGGVVHALAAGDLDRDGRDELFVADDPSREIRRYRLTEGGWVYDVVAPNPDLCSIVALAVIGGR